MLQWPGGRVGSQAPAVQLKFRRTQLLARLAQGRIGELADAYVRGDLEIEGALSDVMAVAAALVGDPVRRGRRPPGLSWLSRLRSYWRHRPGQDARQVRHHYDVCDEFYSLWLDPLRVYSCAYFAAPQASLAQAQ